MSEFEPHTYLISPFFPWVHGRNSHYIVVVIWLTDDILCNGLCSIIRTQHRVMRCKTIQRRSPTTGVALFLVTYGHIDLRVEIYRGPRSSGWKEYFNPRDQVWTALSSAVCRCSCRSPATLTPLETRWLVLFISSRSRGTQVLCYNE